MYKLPNITNNNIGDVFFMRKLLFCFSLLLGISLFLVSCYHEQQEVRIRILSKDNQESSIIFKNELKEETLKLLKKTSYLEPVELTSYLKKEYLKLYPQKEIFVSFEDVMFPSKILDGKFIPSGKYPTVLIKIEEGSGSNWWSILYPEFFGVSYESSDEVEYRSYFFDLFK